MHDVIVLIGSLRRASISRRLASALADIAPPSMALEIIDLAELAMYNEDLEHESPEPWRVFRERVRRADAVLVITPEYNRSIPAVLKNALDVGSRPYGHSVWDGKPCAVISQSPGPLGGFGANHHLRQCMVFLNMPTLQQPEAYLVGSNELLDEQGEFRAAETGTYLSKVLDSFARWIGRVAAERPAAVLRQSA